MVLYSGGGKYVAKTRTKRKWKKPAVHGCVYSKETACRENNDAFPTAPQSSAVKPARRREWLIWAEAILIFLGIMAATAVFLHFRNTGANREFQELAEQIRQAEATAPTAEPQPEYTDSAELADPNVQIPEATGPVVPTILPKYAPLHETNPDFFGWIRMEGTMLDCPVMYSAENNEKYLHANFYGSYSNAGTPFADNVCTRNSDNILIYGHNLRDGSVFHSLLNYADESYWQEHPTIMFSDLYQDYEYEVLAAFYDRVYAVDETAFRYYQFVDAANEEEYDFAVGKFKDKALYDTGVEAEYGDKLLTLSTCAYHVKNGRFVVVARRIG